MIITKFNRLIRSRIVWGAFAILISIAFLGTFSPSRGCSRAASGGSGADAGISGRLYGVDIYDREFNTARFYEMGLRQDVEMTPEKTEQLRMQTWRRLAALRTAQRMGIAASDAEANDLIQRDPSFAIDKVFSREKYKRVIMEYLKTPNALALYEDFIRQDIVLQKIGMLLQSMVWNSPHEVTDKLNGLTDSFRLAYGLLETEKEVKDPKLTDEQIAEFFEKNSEQFRIPERVKVRYVSFPISNYLARAAEELSEEDISDYYDENKELFAVPATNGVTNSISGSTNDTTVVPALADVRDKVVSNLVRQVAAFRAKDTAVQFVIDMTPGADNKAQSFEKLALTNGLAVSTSEYFSASEAVPGLNVDNSFNEAAFRLDPADPEAGFSDPVIGEDYVFVLTLVDRTPSRIPELREVRDDVIPAATEDQRRSAILQKAKDRKASIDKEMAGGKTFMEAARACDLNVSTTQAFTVYGGAQEGFEYAEAVLSQLPGAESGTVLDPIELDEGVLIVYVTERTPGDIAMVQTIRPQLLAAMDRYRAGFLMEDIGSFLLKTAGFEDFTKPVESSQEDEPADESTPPADLLL